MSISQKGYFITTSRSEKICCLSTFVLWDEHSNKHPNLASKNSTSFTHPDKLVLMTRKTSRSCLQFGKTNFTGACHKIRQFPARSVWTKGVSVSRVEMYDWQVVFLHGTHFLSSNPSVCWTFEKEAISPGGVGGPRVSGRYRLGRSADEDLRTRGRSVRWRCIIGLLFLLSLEEVMPDFLRNNLILINKIQ